MEIAIRRSSGLLWVCGMLLLVAACDGASAGTPAQPAPRPTAAASPAFGSTHTWNFDTDTVGTLPTGMGVFSGQWQVRAEPSAPSAPNALCQIGRATYPAIALSADRYGDVVISARFIALSGQEDRAGGFFFRARDRDNFYILRANALEDNVNFYSFVNGGRALLKQAEAKVEPGKWHDLRVEVNGNRMRGTINGSLAIETTSDAFSAPGQVGLWTKEDSVSCFDDVTVREP